MTELLTSEEIRQIAEYTVLKINNYPKRYGKTVENYFDLLFPDEVSNYLMRREINRRGEENRRKRENSSEICLPPAFVDEARRLKA